MATPMHYPIDDKDFDDAALWAVIDSAAAASLSSTTTSRKPLALKYTNNNHLQSPSPKSISKPSPHAKFPQINHHYSPENKIRASVEGEVLNQRPQKIARSCVSEISETSPLALVKHVQRTPTTMTSFSSPESMKLSSPMCGRFSVKECSPVSESSPINCRPSGDEKENFRHSLAGQYPSVSLFKEYQNAAMAILEKTDYTVISGSPFIKKSGWRKISFYFNLSYEIRDKSIEFDENRNVIRAEFVVRAYMQGGRFSDGWGSSERREKRFMKPNHDIPSTAETRAKNKACQDLLGIGEYRPGASHVQR